MYRIEEMKEIFLMLRLRVRVRIFQGYAKGPTQTHPHENALLQKRTRIALFWPTVHMDPENTAPENTLFWNRVSGWRNPKMQPSRFHVDGESTYFPKRWRHRPTTRPLASDLWTPRRLITQQQQWWTTCSCSCHRGYWAFLATYSPCSWVWVTAAVRPHYRSTQKILVSLH